MLENSRCGWLAGWRFGHTGWVMCMQGEDVAQTGAETEGDRDAEKEAHAVWYLPRCDHLGGGHAAWYLPRYDRLGGALASSLLSAATFKDRERENRKEEETKTDWF